MLDAIVTYVLPPAPWGFVTWLVPLGYIALCFVSRARRRASEPAVPDTPAPDPHPPLVHPLLIGALDSRESVTRGSSYGAFDAVLGGAVALVGNGALRFQLIPGSGGQAELDALRGGIDAPVIARGKRISPAQRIRIIDDAFGETMLFTRDRDVAVGPLDEEALALLMAPGSDRMTVAECCRWQRDGIKAHTQQKKFLESSEKLLKRAGLATDASPLERLLDSPLVIVVQLWSLFVVSSMGGAAAGITFTMAVMFFRTALIAGTPPLTPIGAQALAAARANSAWAEAATKGREPLRHVPTGQDLTRLIATLVAISDVQLATDLVERMVREGTFPTDEAGARLKELLRRRPYGIEGSRAASPIEYLHLVVDEERSDAED